MANILIVDDELISRGRIKLLLKTSNAKNMRILEATGVDEALSIIHSERINVIVIDKVLNNHSARDGDGIELIPEILSLQPHVQILVPI